MDWKFWKRSKKERQDWKPHWTIQILYGIWRAAFAAFKIAVGAAATVLLIGLVCCFVFVNMMGDYLETDILPNIEMDLEGSDLDMTSRVWYVDKEGNIQLLQKIFADADREWASYEDIPEDLIHATIAIEDQRFYEHQGVDWFTTIKACARMFFGDSSVGGSSITQQLVKNNRLLNGDETANDVTVQRKVIEIFRALEVERQYDKETILEEYLNAIYLGQQCYGVRAAAAAYFGKELEMLTLAECASLISITNNPSLFDPYGDPFEYNGEMTTGKQRNRMRQELVLSEMLEQGWITEAEFQKAWNEELVFKSGITLENKLVSCANEACGYENIVFTLIHKDDRYYCPKCGEEVEVTKDSSLEIYSWYMDYLLEDVAMAMAEDAGDPWNDDTKAFYKRKIQRGGYNIYSTIDLEVQAQVDKIYQDLMQIPETRSGQQLQSAIVIVDNRTGDIVALAGGVGDQKGFDDWNLATDAEVQSGSSIKPLAVYAPGFELGAISPATVIRDMPIDYSGGAWPKNDDRRYNYSYTIWRGVVRSVNAVAVNTLDLIGTGYSYDFAKNKFGLSSLVDEIIGPDGTVYSDEGFAQLGLGAQTYGVTVKDMTCAFATFANNGVYREGRTFTKVYDSQGNLVLDNTQETRELLSQKTVDYMNYCLVSATQGGTGYEADLSSSWYSVGITTAGKTGSTNDNKDRWYCGFTGYYTAAVWCGYNQPEEIKMVYGGNPAAQLWKKVMEPLHRGKSDVALYDASNMVWVSVCLDSGKIATSACGKDVRIGLVSGFSRVDTVMVYPEDIPAGSCDKHITMEYCVDGVATEWCHKFAEVDPSITFSERSLVRMTQSEINELVRCKPYRLKDEYLMDEYVYLITGGGADAVFHGILGDMEQDQEAPYKVCTVHTQKTWEKYEEENPPEPEDPEDPEDPVSPSVPVMP